MSERIEECRKWAAENGIQWKHVCGLKSELQKIDQERREPVEGARRRAWELYLHYNDRSLKRQPFWRCGFEIVRCWLENSGRDFTAINDYDQIFTAVACEYSEWEERSADELFEFLFSPYVPRKSAADYYEEALDMIVEYQSRPVAACEAEDYGDF